MSTKPEFRPLHIQIRDLLLERIARGEWSAGEPLPSELSLAKEYEVSIGTLRKALDDLVANHLIVRHRGRGTFLTRHSLHEALYRWFSIVRDDGAKAFPQDRVVGREQAPASALEADRLRLGPDETVIRLTRERSLEGELFMHDTISVAAAMFPDFNWPMAADRYTTPYEYYENIHNIKIIEVAERVKAVPADGRDATLLGVREGTPLLAIERIALTFGERPVELRMSRLRSESFSYVNRIT